MVLKKILLMFFCMIFLIGIASAELEYWQTKEQNTANKTIRNFISTHYDKGINDHISKENPLEVYVWYSVYINTWNNANPENRIESCTLVIKQLKANGNTDVLFNTTYTENDADTNNDKYFVRMQDQDGMTAEMLCKYYSYSNYTFTAPADMQLVTTSWECKACQYYEWTLQERNIEKSVSIGQNTLSITNYIKKLFLLNYEILLALFWLFLILMIFIAVGFIFMGCFWLYKYLRSLAK